MYSIYTMRCTFEHNNEIYMGWSSGPLDQVLEGHKRRAKAGVKTLMYGRMRNTNLNGWKIILFMSGMQTKNITLMLYNMHVGNNIPIGISRKVKNNVRRGTEKNTREL